MTTVKSEVDDAAIECGLSVPASWLSSAESSAVEMISLLRAVTRDLLERHDWTGASVTATLTTVAETSSWTLPDAFLRLQRGDNAIYEISPNRRPIIPEVSDGDWSELNAWSFAGAQRYFRKTATTLEFYRPLPTGATVKIAYVSNVWTTSGGSAWTTEATDVAIFPANLLRFGLIYRWRRQKGMRYADEQAEYEAILARAIREDRPRRKFSSTGPTGEIAHPMRVPVPDFIGSS